MAILYHKIHSEPLLLWGYGIMHMYMNTSWAALDSSIHFPKLDEDFQPRPTDQWRHGRGSRNSPTRAIRVCTMTDINDEAKLINAQLPVESQRMLDVPSSPKTSPIVVGKWFPLVIVPVPPVELGIWCPASALAGAVRATSPIAASVRENTANVSFGNVCLPL